MNMHPEEQYLYLLRDILANGVESGDRTGTGTLRVFGRQIRFDLTEGFPLITTKYVWFKGALVELLWFISGDTNIAFLVRNGLNIWNEWPFQRYLISTGQESKFPKYSPEWKEKLDTFRQLIAVDGKFATKWGDLGPVYGKQWRNFNGFDQLAWVIDEIKRNPNSRRLIVSAWNPPEIEEMAKAGLPPCHMTYQFFVINGKLSCHVYIRSWDTFLGGPWNIASYALLTMMVAQVTGNSPHELVISSGDTHLYLNHLEQVKTQVGRAPYAFPTVEINPDVSDIDSFEITDFKLANYQHYPALPGEISV